MRTARAVILALAIIVTACTSATVEVEPSTTTTAPPVASSTTTITVESGKDSPTVDPALGIASIAVLTPDSGGGTRPLLEWEPVEGASSYTLVVVTPEGEAYWGWTGPETAVHVAGEPQLEEFAAGPSVVPGMTWSVAAYDDEFHVIAVSPRAPISP